MTIVTDLADIGFIHHGRRTFELSGKPQRPSASEGARICPLERIVGPQIRLFHYSSHLERYFSDNCFAIISESDP